MDGQFPQMLFSYGFSYRTVFYTLDAQLNLMRFSREILFPSCSQRGNVDSSKAESIQFVSSALIVNDRVFVLYGINDCESVVMNISHDSLAQLLEFEV